MVNPAKSEAVGCSHDWKRPSPCTSLLCAHWLQVWNCSRSQSSASCLVSCSRCCAVPKRQLGVELGAILLIFTGQV